MSLRHLSADRVSASGQQAPVYGYAAPPQVPVERTYGSMPEVPPSNVVVRAAQAPYSKGSLQVTRTGLLTGGTLVLALICFLPCWDAAQMLRNRNFVQWIGYALPIFVFVLSALLVVFFAVAADSIFKQRYPANMQSVALVCSLFVTIAGLLLIVASLPLSHQTVQVANELAYDCTGHFARGIAIANQNLAALRAQPACLALPTVEQCEGYVESPESRYLKYMEQNFRCSGFCVRPGAAAAVPPAEQAAITAAAAGSEVQATPAAGQDEQTPSSSEGQATPVAGQDEQTPSPPEAQAIPAAQEEVQAPSVEDAAGLLTLNTKLLRSIAENQETVRSNETDALATATRLWQPTTAPPTLFTAANFQTTCDGAASRDLLYFGREVGWQFWYTGIILVSISILMGIFEWSTAVLA